MAYTTTITHMAYTITLTRQAQATIEQDGLDGYRFVVTASAAGGGTLSNQVFLYRRLPIDPAKPTGTLEDVFDGVCGPVDLAEVPVDNPWPDDADGRCRKDTVDLAYYSTYEAQDAWD